MVITLTPTTVYELVRVCGTDGAPLPEPWSQGLYVSEAAAWAAAGTAYRHLDVVRALEKPVVYVVVDDDHEMDGGPSNWELFVSYEAALQEKVRRGSARERWSCTETEVHVWEVR